VSRTSEYEADLREVFRLCQQASGADKRLWPTQVFKSAAARFIEKYGAELIAHIAAHSDTGEGREGGA
jgi:hypothetical protein